MKNLHLWALHEIILRKSTGFVFHHSINPPNHAYFVRLSVCAPFGAYPPLAGGELVRYDAPLKQSSPQKTFSLILIVEIGNRLSGVALDSLFFVRRGLEKLQIAQASRTNPQMDTIEYFSRKNLVVEGRLLQEWLNLPTDP